MTPQEIFEQYLFAGMTRNADAQAALFTEDGVLEAPLADPHGVFPRRLAGRKAIRDGLSTFHARAGADVAGQVDVDHSRYVLHATEEPEVFVVEIDVMVDGAMQSLVQIYRLRDEKIVLLRDFFAPDSVR
ncbi:nuclear transport factor 2 family protein [Antrihabitans cavernicola]|uniref:Nuclear transport factor 2 family protein n=1 Tax=Antrihabitans cavernicola TaxID=2495913 RepID=A0A5A7SCL5_9NOCA|nr:nuclear transport factor 2 family protein [Spelaeibacter cavernicola]KAA0023636.1 nuclear transport factor 2 family protein [Spelaeibacter cavernicola]